MQGVPKSQLEQYATLQQKKQECLAINTTYSGGKEFCPLIWDEILCWTEAPANTTVTQPCPEYFHGFSSERNATKFCTANGTWFYDENMETFWTDYSACVPQPYIPYDDYQSSLTYGHFPIIEAISQTGYGISLITLIVAFIILASFKKLRCSRNLLHMHLFVSFMLRAGTSLLKNNWLFKGDGLNSLFEIGESDAIFGGSKETWACKFLISLWQFSLLANYLWIFMEGLYLHNLIFLSLFSDTSSIKMYVIIGWSLPLFFITPWVILKLLYEDRHCWAVNYNKYYLLFITIPMAISTFVNFGMFLNIIRVLLLKLTASISEDSRRYRKWAKSTLVLIPLFGVHYALFSGMSFSIGKNELIEVIWLYCDQLFASFQGFFVAVLYCFMNNEVRTEIKKKFGNARPDFYSDTERPSRGKFNNQTNNSAKKGSGTLDSCMISFMSKANDFTLKDSALPRPLHGVNVNDTQHSLLETSLNLEKSIEH
ncbi:vasoactive intestinal polypeptide receptor 2-like [Cimex lectularius]|uniref:Uncharacterized protein n=1 Tax=Cimex lectularius TaxID=79782 RepID=A0A8I6RTN2_CIMLE|nr:vasoactive intestinal polypeptide receptor 2-like [Cimex lectularius]